MEPSSRENQPNVEQQPNTSEHHEAYHEIPQAPERAAERAPERHEDQPTPVQAQPTIDPSQIALPTPVQPTPSADDSTAGSDDTPLQAADEDLIEKEWVDKAKLIIAETKDDPHKRETEIAKLQADYLKKRYGKEIGEAA